MVATQDREGRRVSIYDEEGFKGQLAIVDAAAEALLEKEMQVGRRAGHGSC